MASNWKRMSGTYVNLNLGVEVYRGATNWYARNIRTGSVSSPQATLRLAKLAAYEVIA